MSAGADRRWSALHIVQSPDCPMNVIRPFSQQWGLFLSASTLQCTGALCQRILRV